MTGQSPAPDICWYHRCSNSVQRDAARRAHRLYVTDQLTKMSFLVDTGADICVYPFENA
jgi:hypothetical protein